ncbi:MAG: hypothetical protein BWK76_14675 [Desulfobulbaceae bacterium A2]|nr:MAG: hypothetical protein BWK76_14675 [Desulfobulbaceae bacterium A2]
MNLTTASRLVVDDIEVELRRKRVKNINLRVYADGRVTVSAPARMPLVVLHAFVAGKLAWVRVQRERLRQRPPRDADHAVASPWLLWGRPCQFIVQECQVRPKVALEEDRLLLTVRPGTDEPRRAALLEHWLCEQLRQASEPLVRRWEKIMGVRATRVAVRRMTSRWGSCTPATGAIRLNVALIRWPPEYLEYVVVHELVHLLEASHNDRFWSLMDQYLPQWRVLRQQLHCWPPGHNAAEQQQEFCGLMHWNH